MLAQDDKWFGNRFFTMEAGMGSFVKAIHRSEANYKRNRNRKGGKQPDKQNKQG